MKKLKKIAALTLAAACAATVCAGAAFTDQSDIKVDSKVIDTLVEKNVIKGYENGSFQPNETVSRAEMAKMIYVCLLYTSLRRRLPLPRHPDPRCCRSHCMGCDHHDHRIQHHQAHHRPSCFRG